MKKIIYYLFFTIMPISVFGIGGFGLQLGQGAFSVEESYPETGIPGVTLTNGAFNGSFALGGYAYVDLIPFVDIEFDFNAQGNTYDIEFQNAVGSMPKLKFAWVSGNTYTTVRKKVIGLSIPFLAGAQLHAGAGINTHSTVPIADVDMVKNLLGGDLTNSPESLDEALLAYLEDDNNLVSSTGFHVQTGFQFKLLMIDTFLVYRHTFAEMVVPNAKSFGTLNIRLGFGL